ncbi:hypothetical protein P153DRAFT_366242 [Dothidotthia symphoricarpi CBS 119687]|uniref:Uncharacterized protein n=1 Tax=Dothidotthia symphoricarpi CBS 119687 TaxID=1392245 RepID=A0A6A6AD93_9PLEO|nr:uncharacterized protein P153DRAFT_366242 [Dothidotthia symphoricarpi CBS 119687]KAF2129740.1 hypothetical protein P153DRAFT_366242 [Dothidotthia symphoricarpi CBS 119687]
MGGASSVFRYSIFALCCAFCDNSYIRDSAQRTFSHNVKLTVYETCTAIHVSEHRRTELQAPRRVSYQPCAKRAARSTINALNAQQTLQTRLSF